MGTNVLKGNNNNPNKFLNTFLTCMENIKTKISYSHHYIYFSIRRGENQESTKKITNIWHFLKVNKIYILIQKEFKND